MVVGRRTAPSLAASQSSQDLEVNDLRGRVRPQRFQEPCEVGPRPLVPTRLPLPPRKRRGLRLRSGWFSDFPKATELGGHSQASPLLSTPTMSGGPHRFPGWWPGGVSPRGVPRSPPVALRAEAGVAIHFIDALGPVLAAVSPAVVQVLTAVVACVAWCALTPGGGQGAGGQPGACGFSVCDREPPGPVGLGGPPDINRALDIKMPPACPGTLL